MSGRVSPLPNSEIGKWLKSLVDLTDTPSDTDILNLREIYRISNPEFTDLVAKIQSAIDGKISFDVPHKQAKALLGHRGVVCQTPNLALTRTPTGVSPSPVCGSPGALFKTTVLASGRGSPPPLAIRRLSFQGVSGDLATFTALASPASGLDLQGADVTLTMGAGASQALPEGKQVGPTRSSTPTARVTAGNNPNQVGQDGVIDLGELFLDQLPVAEEPDEETSKSVSKEKESS